MEKSTKKEILEWIYCIIIAVVLALLVRYFIGTPTVVKQVSMKPTLIENQRLILNRWTRTTNKTPERGDIITFEAPVTTGTEKTVDNPVAEFAQIDGLLNKFCYYVLEIGKKSYIKRVIGLPGEHVEIKNGKVYINGEILQEDYLADTVVTDSLGGLYTNVIVPEGCIFAMGDNRPQSTDSRILGCIPIEKLEGKVVLRFWPFDVFGKVD